MLSRMSRLRLLGAALAAAGLAVAAALAVPGPASAAALTEVTNFGANPSNLRMYLYVPDTVAARPGLLVVNHYCTGSGPAMYSGTQFASLADRYGYIVVYPSVTRSSKCFDVSSPQALRRDGGSDPVGIKSMVDYVRQRYPVESQRIFVTGTSSGAMMTNVLLGDYPDVFRAGAAFAGVPFGCFATTNGSEWNSECANGQVLKTPQQWGDLVRNAYPGYTGPRPRMQIWHGTNDETLRYPNFGEQIDQWTNVNGLSQTPAYTDSPQPGYTRTRYGGTGGTATVEAISMQGVTHNLPVDAAQVIRFFGLDSSTPPPTTAPPTTPPPTTAPPTTPPPTTPPPTTAPPTTPPPSGACRVGYVVNAWNNGLTTAVTITNTSTTAINGWSLAFTLPGGQTITGGWNATYSPSSGAVTARNVSYNASIPPGGSVDIGFQATHTGNTGSPASFTLNGSTCTTS
ncbi:MULTISPECIES: PHB depolymerase family esterase [unclassified Micromonospora]|uniref:extracellular catalytic domain type 1 short-chain-length polyhydroxyalkanoate depolymerase n=1 Tax=unclassified Micromonospora TaxID=2617518 RepID=UPI0022B6FABE|nr:MULTISPECIES: PHB depolymerase family esterase [unclassified Micromonospora]MCZ7475281.1 PHB depolymerase family esterase [Micromonospora sp. WMMC273]WBC05891.1 PHB depolymerase family esterase [Micromonospora sp. WMMA1976]